ncbi:MAG: hypothetical protein J6Q65_02985 [Lentisphaeria bacterium]|nr:hypothetical protein [Lentisphaeria bacterium]
MKLFRIALIGMMAFVLTAVVTAAPKLDKKNPFKSELGKIAKVEGKIAEGENKDLSSKQKKKLEEDLEKAQEKLAKKKDKLISRTEKEIAKLEKDLEKVQGKEGQDAKIEKLNKELEAKRNFLKNIPIWAQGETPSEDGLGIEE